MKKILLCLLIAFLNSGCSYNSPNNYAIELENSITKVSEEVSSTVIKVNSYYLSNNRIGSAIGSGVIYNRTIKLKDGSVVENANFSEVDTYIYNVLTNRHVIDGAYRYQICFEDDVIVEAELLGCDNKVDLAILSFEYPEMLNVVQFADSDTLKKGSIAIAIGNPDGFYGSLTFGVISYPNRYLSDDTDDDGINDYQAEYIQTDAAINPGNSGGGLFDLNGKLIGINTLKIVDDKIDNMGFAIPINIIKILIPFLEVGKIPSRVELGILIVDIDNLDGNIISIPENIDYGMYVRSIEGNSVASKIGMRAGDVIISMNGTPIKKSYQIYVEINKMLIGSNNNLTFEVIRNNEEMTLSAIV